ncbi:SurA N-terminal domain-containing protein [Alcanivorax marinus]|uniref:Periplasmic chaperone PpiD n=1 Tax=Alloalcanivorax marinus TaxID=1177169 RepID=A0A9Q3UQB4_9GAMM|nr:SurA N-terminal domain-containing protein [Alloalcanivorax marinus]MCC4310151.1 SurA N-terminal domain-containing protein [Alloalcanivorax marinus]
MQEFRRFVRGPVGKVLLAAIILPFVISGFYGYFTGGGSDSTVAEVEGNKITRAYVNSRTQQLRQMLRQQSPDINESVLDSFIRPQMVLEGIVNEQLMIAAARNADMAFSDTQAARMIRANPAFTDEGGFSKTRFEQMVRSQGMTPQGYLDGLRQERISQQYRQAFAATDFALPGELAEQRRLGEQSRDIRYVRLDLDRLRGEARVSDEEIQAYYDENRDSFMRPEQVKVQYLVLSPEHYRDRVDISDEQIEAEYEARRQMQQDGATRRQVAHVLIAVNDDRDEEQAIERAREARQALEQGASFAQVARDYSDDRATAGSGGELGIVEPGTLPEALDDALNGLQVGQVSEPVVSDAGVHLLKLESESKPEMAPLADMRDAIAADLRRSQSQALLSEDLVTLEELIYEHANLEVPAEQLNLPLETTDWVSLQNLPAPLNNDRVRQALNSDPVREQGHNSDLLELGGDRYAAVRLQEVEEPEPLPLADVSDDIRAQLRLNKARDRAEELATQARDAVEKDDADLDRLATLLGTEVEEEQGVQRGAAEPDMAVSDAAFATPRPAEGQASDIRFVDLRNGDLVALQVTAVADGNADPLPDEQQQQALQELARVEGERTFRQVMTFLRDSLDVELHPNRLADTDAAQ